MVFVGLGLSVNELYADAGYTREQMTEIILQHILVATILAGLLQITVGVLKLGKFIRLVPQPAMFGFVNGLAIVITMAQFKFFAGESWVMYALVGATMLIIFTLSRVTKAVPAGLVAIILGTIIIYFTGLETKTVGDLADISGTLPTPALPEVPLTLEMIQTVLPYAVLPRRPDRVAVDALGPR